MGQYGVQLLTEFNSSMELQFVSDLSAVDGNFVGESDVLHGKDG